jgi:transcriptional regulator with XRE-family HTH domain
MLTSKKVRSLRLLLGLKQQELADITGLSFSLISSIERGRRSLTTNSENRIRKALNLNEQIIQNLTEIEAGLRA